MQVYFPRFFMIFAGYPQDFLFLIPLSTYQQMDFPGNGSFLPKSSRPAESMILFSHVLFIELLKYICCKTDGFQTAHIVLLIDLHQL